MKSKRSSTTSRRYNGNAAQILGAVLDSQLGVEVAGVLSSALSKMLGLKRGTETFEELRRQAREAAQNFEREGGRANPFRTLGLDPGADHEQVKHTYLYLMKKYHPDGTSPDGKRAKEINGAYEQICREKGWPR